MIALTSIAPKHFHDNIQLECVNSWLKHGLKVYSFNNPSEVELLKDKYPKVTFIPTRRTMEHTLKNPYVQVNAMLDWAKDQPEENILLINSDIQLHEAKEKLTEGFTHAKNGVVYSHRLDYENEIPNVKEKMTWGFDVFFLNKSYIDIFPQSLYCFGQTHWDYWLPYTAIQAGLKISEIDLPAYHKLHPTQWDEESYFKMGQYTIFQTNYPHKVFAKNRIKLKNENNFIGSILYNKIKLGR